MLFLDRAEMDKRFRVLRQELLQRPISDELRGWNYGNPPVKPISASLRFGVGELASRYCETLRDIYLKRVLGVKPPPSYKMIRGVAFHEVMKTALFDMKRFIYDHADSCGKEMLVNLLPRSESVGSGALAKAESVLGGKLDEYEANLTKLGCANLYEFLIVQGAAALDRTLSKYPHAESDSIVNVAVPPVSERKVDGSLVGLSTELSVDIYTPFNAIADVKTGEVRSFHPLTLAGYALAIESDEGISIDFGFIIYIRVDKKVPSFAIKHLIVGEEYRREFLEVRDEAHSIIRSGKDPGKPSRCPNFCPYYGVC
ncbi:MAG: type I-A CRISPR-associated protein Cas4/Csa1 [Nitrososphaerales archaeon]